jgi:hypothetical protein
MWWIGYWLRTQLGLGDMIHAAFGFGLQIRKAAELDDGPCSRPLPHGQGMDGHDLTRKNQSELKLKALSHALSSLCVH